MSAIDFHMSVDVVEDPKGDRIEVTMSGKFLPYNAWWRGERSPLRRPRARRRVLPGGCRPAIGARSVRPDG